MKVSDLFSKISQFINKTSKPVAKAYPDQTSKFVTKINETFSASKLKSVGIKIAGAAMTANLVDGMVDDVPVVNNVYQWVANTYDDIYEATIRKVPVVGNWIRKITDFINGLIIPNAQKGIVEHRNSKVNDPKFYSYAGMHTEFQIPMCYPDSVGVPFGGNKNFGSIALVKLGYNPLTSYTKIKSRYTQLLDLLKGVRGLSGQLPYSEGDIFFYDWNTKYLILEYFRLKYALKLSRVYSLTKATLPTYLLSKLGWDASDFIENKALYASTLVQMHSYITDSIPCFGIMNERIEGLLNQLIPDSNDPKVALYYCVDLSIVTLIPDPSLDEYEVWRSHFRKDSSNMQPGNNDIDLDPNSVVSTTYAAYNSGFITFQSHFPTINPIYASIKGDLVGAFGKSVIWTDPKINDINTATADSMYHSFDELFLTQLQNGTILDRVGNDLRTSGTISEAIQQGLVVGSITIPAFNTNGSVVDLIRPASVNDYAYIVGEYKADNPEGTAGVIYMPQTDGASFIGTVGHTKTNETAIIGNKYKYSETENLEIIQLLSWFENSSAYYSSGQNGDFLNEVYRTNTFFIERVYMLYYNVVTKQNAEKRIRPRNIVAGTAAITAYNNIQDVLETTQFWSQADYGIKLPMSVTYSNLSADTLLLDFNIMGSLSKSGYDTGVLYSTYSLYSAGIKINEATGRRINNIVDAYKIR